MRFNLTCILLSVVLLQVGFASNAQQVSISKKNASLTEVFKEIKKQSGYDFLYSFEELEKGKPIDINVRNRALTEVLDLCFSNQPFTYKINHKTIVIIPKNTGSFGNILSITLMDIRGVVLNELGAPLAGATISVKDGNLKTSSNERGEFSLRDVDDKAIIQVSYTGYEMKELAAAQNLGNIQLAISISSLQEVNVAMVNTGYQILDKDRAAGSFSKPDLNVVLDRTSTPNVLTRLEGLVPGLTTRGPSGLVIRGQTSLSVGTTPLIVVDGIEFNGVIEQINANDIESIDVLKDATSASIWGAKAANGVIVIITKRGKSGDKLKVDYNAYYAFQGRPDLDYVPRLNSQQFIALSRELFPQFLPFNKNYASVASIFNNLPHLQIQYDRARNKITQAQADFKLDSLGNLSNKDQIADLFVRDAATLNQTISVAGGSKAHTFYGSLNHLGRQNNTPGSQDNQYKIVLNNSFILSKRISVSINADLTNTVIRSENTYNPSRTIVPYQMFQDANGNSLNINYLGAGFSGTAFPDSLRTIYQSRGRINLDYNPILEQNRAYSTNNGLAGRLVGTIKANVLKGLDFQGTYGYNLSNSNSRAFRSQDNYEQRLQVTQFAVAANPTVVPVYNIPASGGRLVVGSNSSRAWTLRNQLTYNHDWNKHQLSLMGGQQATSSTPISTTGTYYGWDDQLQTSMPIDVARLAAGVTGTMGGTATLTGNNVGGGEGRIERSTAYFATLGYTFNRKYTFNASWRIDESNLFGRDKSAQNRPVYSFGALWALGREDFMRSISWLDRLDVRLTYGITGNSPGAGTASSYNILTAQNNVDYVTGAGFILSSPANTKLTWEGTKVYNGRIDFGIFKNKLSGSIEGYIKKTEDLIGELATSPLTGYEFVTGNFGNMENKGIDIGLNSVNITGRDFTWNSGFTLSYNKNKLTKLRQTAPATGAALVTTTRRVGYPLNTSFVYNYGGLNAAGDPQIRRADGSLTSANNVALPADILYMGTTQPVWSGALQNSFKYKTFRLSASIIYNAGYVVRSNYNPTFGGDQIFAQNSLQLGFLDRWKVANDENRTDIPRYAPSAAIANARNMSYYTSSQKFMLNGAYAKLRDITLEYSLSQLLARKIRAQAISFNVQLNNLLLWTANDQGMDPEFSSTTRTAQGTVSLGARVSF